MNGFTKPVKTSVIMRLKEKLILYVVNAFEYFMLNSSFHRSNKLQYLYHKLKYHLSLCQYQVVLEYT